MFYANNEQVKGIFLNGNSYNYLACGFSKIIPEDRTAEHLNLNLAYKYLNQYRVEFGTVKDGYENALVSPRFDKPDSNGIFHTPFTYYYDGNIVPTKEVDILITDGNYALSNALVYSDMNINGAINYFATNTDFQGHNVNVFPEKDNYQSSPLLNYEMLNNCNNFDLNISTRFSKAAYPTLYNCNNFSGNFRYVGNQDNNYPGFRGFLYQCRDGVFNIDCTNMHGGGSDANVRNYVNFSGIQRCENMNVNITGSSWQVWPHDHSFSSNCNINTYNVISGFSYMNYCNFNVVLPKDSNPEMNQSFEFLNNAENCNYNLYATDVNLFSYRSGVGHNLFFDGLNNCNLNLLVSNTVSFDHSFGSNFNYCNIVFDNIKADLTTFIGWRGLHNCNITGNVEVSSGSQGFLERCDAINVNINAAKSSSILAMWRCNNANGNLVCGDSTTVNHCTYLNLNVSKGRLYLDNIEYGNLRNVYNSTVRFINVNNTDAICKSQAFVSGINNCYNLSLYDFNVVNGAILENVYDSFLSFNSADTRRFRTVRVNNCSITGFPYSFPYTTNCIFNVGIEKAMTMNSSYITWNNVWPHGFRRSGESYRYLAGLRTVSGFMSLCSMAGDDMVLGGNRTFNNINNMQCDIKVYYNGIVTANLPMYNMDIKFNVDCNTLNLGIFLAGPPHGFQNATISANTIYAKGDKPGAYVQVNADTKIYCENYCNTAFYFNSRAETDVLQSVLLINNYQHSSSTACYFSGGLTRIGRLNFQGGAPADLYLKSGACVFINNALLGKTTVDQNSLLFLGSNVRLTNSINVTNGGLVVNKANWGSHASVIWGRVGREHHLAWNVWDSGPWGNQSLFDYCINV